MDCESMDGAGDDEELNPHESRWEENWSEGREGNSAGVGSTSGNGGVYVPSSTGVSGSLRIETPFFLENEKKLLLLESRLGRFLSGSPSTERVGSFAMLEDAVVQTSAGGSRAGEVGLE